MPNSLPGDSVAAVNKLIVNSVHPGFIIGNRFDGLAVIGIEKSQIKHYLQQAC